MSYDCERSYGLTLISPAWPLVEPHGPTWTVIRGGEHAAVMLRALLLFGHKSTRASPHIPRVTVRDQRAGGLKSGVMTL